MPDHCSVTGSKTALAAMNGDEICARFTGALEGMLAPAGLPEGLRIALTLHDRGAIDATITHSRDGAAVTYPRLTVDAIDRALRPGDVTRLAEAAAGMLNNNATGAAAAPAGKAERN